MGKKSDKRDSSSPFAKLKELSRTLAEEESERAEREKKERVRIAKLEYSKNEEERLLAEAMKGVRPIEPTPPRKRLKPGPPAKSEREEDDDEALQHLVDLVEGGISLDYSASDEHVEARSTDCSRRDLARLKAGEFAVQAHLDLHGNNREEARAALEKFFKDASIRGYRCVLIVTGRGLHTPGGKPVLKELLMRWLAQGGLSRYVLAFSSALPHDGGVGALYVLLRKNPKRV